MEHGGQKMTNISSCNIIGQSGVLKTLSLRRKCFMLIMFPALVIFFLMISSAFSESSGSDSKTTFIFIQTAVSGSFTPISGKTGEFIFELRDVSHDTVYVSDRPERIVGAVQTGKFLKGFDFGIDNPPNAAVVLTEPISSEQDVVLVELTQPQYDEKMRKLTYRASLLGEYKGLGLKSFIARKDESLPKEFRSVSVYIDDCPDNYVRCYGGYRGECRVYCGYGTGGKVGYCWNWTLWGCYPCRGDYTSRCTGSGGPCDKTFPTECSNRNDCTTVTSVSCF